MEQSNADFWKVTKHAFVSILIGACISFLTVVFQELVNWLQGLQPAAPGVIAGIGKYLYSWTSNHSA